MVSTLNRAGSAITWQIKSLPAFYSCPNNIACVNGVEGENVELFPDVNHYKYQEYNDYRVHHARLFCIITVRKPH